MARSTGSLQHRHVQNIIQSPNSGDCDRTCVEQRLAAFDSLPGRVAALCITCIKRIG